MFLTSDIADRLIPAARNKKVLLKEDYKTSDIVREVLDCFRESADQTKGIAPYLKGKDLEDTCRNIWQFLKRNVRYSLDPDSVQWVKEPARVWKDKKCDCKSFSIFIASILKNLGIKGAFRFVSFNNDPNPTHVYMVVRNKGKDIIIDDVMPRFNTEAKYTTKKDYDMSGLYRVSGLPTISKLPTVSGVGRLPVVSCLDDDSAAVGNIGDPFQGLKKLLSGQKAQDLIIQMAPAMLYMWLPSPSYWFNDKSAAAFFDSLPAIVQQKAAGASGFHEWAHDKWGWKYAPLGHLEHKTITALLGMDPQKYLDMVIGHNIAGYYNTTNARVGCTSPRPIGSILDSATKVVTQAGDAGADAATGGAASAIFSILSGIAKSLVNFNIPQKYSAPVIGPSPTDWTGYATRLPVGVVTPTLADPLGSGINNGLYDGNGNPLPQATKQTAVPVQDAEGNIINAPSKNAAISPLLFIGLAGAAVMLMMSGKKGKKAAPAKSRSTTRRK